MSGNLNGNASRNTRRRVSRKQRRGAALVELALVLPISMLMIVVAVDLCWLQVVRHTADVTAYEAAKSAFIPGADDHAIESEATSQLKRFRVNEATVNVTTTEDPGAAQSATVDITVPVGPNTWTLAKLRGTVVVQRVLKRGS